MAVFAFSNPTPTTNIKQENLTSQINGTNNSFTVNVNFISSSLRVYYNGLRQTTTFFTIISNNQFQTTFTPSNGDNIEVDYIPS